MNEFIAQVESRQIEEVTINTKDNTLDVKETNGEDYSTGFPDNSEQSLLNRLERNDIQTQVKGKGGSSLLSLLTYILPFLLFFGFWIFLMNQMQGGGSRVMSFGKSRAKRMSVDAPKITFRDVAGADEAVQELHEIKEFLENPKKFQSLGARIPRASSSTGLPAPVRPCSPARSPARPAFPSSRSRAPTSSRCSSGLAPPGSATCSSRRSRTRPASSSWTRSTRSGATAAPDGRWPRRARADPEPAPGRDGRLRDEGQHHLDRGHQPARHPRPGAAAARPLRPPDRRRPPRPQGPQADPRGPHPGQAAGEGDRPRRARRPDPRLHRRRPRQPDQRGGAADRAHRQARDHDAGARRGDDAGDRRPREKEPGDVGEGAPCHRLPRARPRDRRPHAPTPTRCTRSRSSAGARRSATRSRCPPRTSSSPPGPSSPTRWR